MFLFPTPWVSLSSEESAARVNFIDFHLVTLYTHVWTANHTLTHYCVSESQNEYCLLLGWCVISVVNTVWVKKLQVWFQLGPVWEKLACSSNCLCECSPGPFVSSHSWKTCKFSWVNTLKRAWVNEWRVCVLLWTSECVFHSSGLVMCRRWMDDCWQIVCE